MTAAVAFAQPAGWLRDRDFDLRFIGGVALLALVSGGLVLAEPRVFPLVLALDLWFAGHPHVVSTFTRLCFDRASYREHRRLLWLLPPAILVLNAGLFFAVGPWILVSVYLYWQWFHYTRQSWGVARIYARRAGMPLPGDRRLELVAFHAVPLWGILHRSHQAPATFLGAELRVLPVPALAVDSAAALALGALGLWLAVRAAAAWRGELPLAHTLYALSHHAIFLAAYVAIPDATHGWLVANLWHNLQYLLFVWLANARRFERGPDPAAPLLSRISQPGRGMLFFAACLAVGAAVYLAVEVALGGLAIALVAYQTINFHHYVVDGLIWKTRRGSRSAGPAPGEAARCA
jgi:hypothetical protein